MHSPHLTPRQADCLRAIRQLGRPNGVAPSYREIAAHMGLASVSGVQRMVDALQAQGILAVDGHRSIRIVAEGPSKTQLADLPDRALRRIALDCRNLLGERGASQ